RRLRPPRFPRAFAGAAGWHSSCHPAAPANARGNRGGRSRRARPSVRSDGNPGRGTSTSTPRVSLVVERVDDVPAGDAADFGDQASGGARLFLREDALAFEDVEDHRGVVLGALLAERGIGLAKDARHLLPAASPERAADLERVAAAF